MEVISFRCPSCKQVLKIGADKAGRKGKCKCGAEVVVPSASEAAAAAPAAATPPPLPAKADDDDEGGIYNLIGDFAEPSTPKEEKPKKRDEDIDLDDDEEDGLPRPTQLVIGEKDRPKGKFRVTKARTLLEPEKWLKVCRGLNVVSIGLWVWLGAMLLREIPVIIGVFNPSDYAKLRLRWENPRIYAQTTKEGSADDVRLSKTEFMYGLVTGDGPLTAGLWLFRLSALLLIGAGGTLLVGYGMCLAVPNRFSTVRLVYTLLALGSVNVLFTIVFRVLPTFGAMDYVLIPVAVPEIALLDANIDRETALAVSLSALPFLDYTLSFFVLFVYFLEPVVLGMLVRAIGLSMKGPEVEDVGSGMIRLGLGVAFIWLAYMQVMVTGSSEVLLWLLRVVYLLGTFFFMGQLAWFAVEIAKLPSAIQKELDVSEMENRRDEPDDEPDDEDDEEDEEDDEEDDEDRKRGYGKPSRRK